MRKFILIVFLLLITAGFSGVIMMYSRILRNNVEVPAGEFVYLFIPTGSDFNDAYRILREKDILRDTSSFRWVAIKKNYPNHVNPGRYRMHSGMSNNRLVGMLRSGNQEPVQLVFNNIRTPQKLAGVIASQIEADSMEILSVFSDKVLIGKHSLIRETILGVFIPNTYEIYWNTSGEEFLDRMVREYRIFWDENRLALARGIELEPMEVMTLASIVDEETLMTEEESRIAGVYINRLNRRIRLHADPTV